MGHITLVGCMLSGLNFQLAGRTYMLHYLAAAEWGSTLHSLPTQQLVKRPCVSRMMA